MGRHKNSVNTHTTLGKWYNKQQRLKFHKALKNYNREAMEELEVCERQGLCPACAILELEDKYGIRISDLRRKK